MEEFKKKWLTFVREMNEKGIPIPFIRDPVHKIGSVSLTLVVISAALVIIGIVGKVGLDLKIDVEQALQFFYGCSALYFGRGLTAKGGATIDGATTSTKTETKTSASD